MNQVAEDNELLATAQDCLRFVTKFFEVINVSATHIYHSALELCPMSSIIRKLYYDRCHRITGSPRIAIGTPDSWDRTVSISSKNGDYESSTWSPCGQFVAAQTSDVVEIRNPLPSNYSPPSNPPNPPLNSRAHLPIRPMGVPLPVAPTPAF
jgi:hypothetical protein